MSKGILRLKKESEIQDASVKQEERKKHAVGSVQEELENG
jgi:hypothetical protein